MSHDIRDHLIERQVHDEQRLFRDFMPLAELAHDLPHELGLSQVDMEFGAEASGPHSCENYHLPQR
jgi:hypothetical protein